MVDKVLLHVHTQFVPFVENYTFSIEEFYVSLLQQTKSNNNKEQSKTKQKPFGHPHKERFECEMCLTGSDDCHLVLTSRPWWGDCETLTRQSVIGGSGCLGAGLESFIVSRTSCSGPAS